MRVTKDEMQLLENYRGAQDWARGVMVTVAQTIAAALPAKTMQPILRLAWSNEIATVAPDVSITPA
jgi:hypothetical protein